MPTVVRLLLVSIALCSSASAQTLSRIRATHTLRCATISEIAEYSSTDDHGPRTAFDADLCRAVAVAILGPNARVAITAYPDDVAAAGALRAHKVDLVPTLTLDLNHAAGREFTFSQPMLYDGVGFLVPTSAGIERPGQLSGRKVCFLGATHVEVALQEWFAREHLSFVPFPFSEEGEMEAAFVTGNCDALAGDLTRLAFVHLNFGPLASRYTFLPAEEPLQIASDPLAAASASSDPAFANIIRWTREVLLNAEAGGLTQSNAASSAPPGSSDGSTIAVLSGRTHEIGSRLGLANSWALAVITAVGNYGELFDRDLGAQSPLKLPRAQNRLAYSGGLMLPLPLK